MKEQLLDIKNIDFYKERLQSEHLISGEMLRNINIESIDARDFVCDNIIVRLVKDVARTDQLYKEITTKYEKVPRTWWDHLKYEMPDWLSQLFREPSYRKIRCEIIQKTYNVYPNVTELNEAIRHSENTIFEYTSNNE